MSVTLSPIYAHFSETLSGLATIRALRDEARFKQENEQRLETNQRANFCGKEISLHAFSPCPQYRHHSAALPELDVYWATIKQYKN